MFRFSAIILAAGILATPALAGERRVHQIDTVIATQKEGGVTLEAKGAVESGGWKSPRLKLVKNDGHTMTIEFVAMPPPTGMPVIDGLVPVTAITEIKGHAVSVRVQAEANEITTQVLK